MNISEMIKELEQILNAYGDGVVFIKPPTLSHPFSSELNDEMKVHSITVLGEGSKVYISDYSGDIDTIRERG
jgi:hypothetical protein